MSARVATAAPVSRALDRYVRVPGEAVNLAVLRVVVFGAIFVHLPLVKAAQFAALPAELVRVPAGAGWLVALPRSPGLATAATWLLGGACMAAIVGWRTRLAVPAAAVLSLYVLGIPQLYGKVDHYHHLVWLALLLAVSPCGDALALDHRGRARSRASIRYGQPIRVAWLLIGSCYFFPGLAKLTSGHWFDPENGQRLLDVQRWAAGLPPMLAPRPLLVAAAVATVAFELGFTVLVFTRWRRWALAAGVAFHLATFALLGILFWSLMLCYVAFVDWSAIGARRGRGRGRERPAQVEETSSGGSPTLLQQAACVALVASVAIAGATFVVDGWPFASYPTFADPPGAAAVTLEAVTRMADGREVPVELFPWAPKSRRAALTWNAVTHPQAFTELLPAASSGLSVYRVTVDVRTQTVIDRTLVWQAS